MEIVFYVGLYAAGVALLVVSAVAFCNGGSMQQVQEK